MKKLGILSLVMITACASAFILQVKAENKTYTDSTSYSVTIPAEVTIPYDSQDTGTLKSAKIPISATLQPNTNVVITISSDNKKNNNKFELVNGNSTDDNKRIGYTLSDVEPLVFSNSDSTGEKEKTYELEATLARKSIVYSGEYTDRLTFDISSFTKATEDQKYYLNFDINTDDPTVAITTNKKVVKSGEAYGTLPTPRRKGYNFDGWFIKKTDPDDADQVNKDTVMGNKDVDLYAKWTVHRFKNTMTFWAWGLKKQEGNNGPGTALRLASNATQNSLTAYGTPYEFTTAMATALQVKIPNGYALKQFGSATVEESSKWKRYDFDANGKFSALQPDWSVNAEYEYDLIDYKITYDLDGGTNSDKNPSTYNVLYGVTFAEPVKEGYTFDGWYIGDTKVTGINENCVNNFRTIEGYNEEAYATAATNFYAELDKRTAKNITVKAHWKANDVSSSTDDKESKDDNEITDDSKQDKTDATSDIQTADQND